MFSLVNPLPVAVDTTEKRFIWRHLLQERNATVQRDDVIVFMTSFELTGFRCHIVGFKVRKSEDIETYPTHTNITNTAHYVLKNWGDFFFTKQEFLRCATLLGGGGNAPDIADL